ncbi:MAG: carboxymuconolactone decarboxylase family protein [Candidatus Hermodarchaeota archaeon]
MNKREKEIAFVAASFAAGCIPCLKYHKRQAQAAGLNQDELLKIARYAFNIRQKASLFNISYLDDVLNGDNLLQTERDETSKDSEDITSCCEE